MNTCLLRAPIYLAFIMMAVSATDSRAAQDELEPPELTALSGFKVERIYTVPRDQGSWISLAVDSKGRLFTSDQKGSLYRVSFFQRTSFPRLPLGRARIEPIHPVLLDIHGRSTGKSIGSAQGLLWAFDSLYVVVNQREGSGSGLYRVTSSNGDVLDQAHLLAPISSSGEQGPHGLALAPDGKKIYMTAGADSGLPPCEISDVPRAWGGDQLFLPTVQGQQWHSKNGLVPGGWVARFDADGTKFEVICAGLRNSYRMAFNADGEAFTTDNDDQWGIGLSWYHPPRVCHILPGADFGWRGSFAEWPTHFPDGQDGIVNLPRGAPSAVLFGTGAKFPARYQRALFAVDWAYGKIFAVHLQPKGATYTGTTEIFLSGKPLAIADAVIGGDGAMYFVTGGREIESALYRVTYSGSESTAPAPREIDTASEKARGQRRALDALQGRSNPASLEAAWPFLDDPDAVLRAAARAVIEAQDAQLWQERVFAETRTQARLTSAMALARCGSHAVQERLLRQLDAAPWPALSDLQRVELLRVYALVFIRMGKPEQKMCVASAAILNTHYPSRSELVDEELSRVLAYLGHEQFIDKTLDLCESHLPQERRIHLGFALSETKSAWTAAQRERHARWLRGMASFQGGRQVLDVLTYLKKLALDAAPDEQRATLQAILGPEPQPLEVPERKFVKEWTLENVMTLLKSRGGLHGRNYARGQSVFASARCITCHYFNGDGSDIGPDLTSVAWHFDKRAIVESIVDPSKVIEEQYASSQIVLNDGRHLTGRVVNDTQGKIQFCADPLKPAEFVDVDKATIKSIVKSTVSTMPVGLLNTFNGDEILDLLAYLVSGGDPGDKAFKP